jgi:hypothetical protein
MAIVQHSTLTGTNLHESKGVSTATSKTTYIADGVGSGAWSKVGPQSLSGVTTNGSDGQLVSVNGSGSFVLVSGAHGQTDFFNTTPYSLAIVAGTPAKLAPTTTPNGVSQNITEATTARLTYTGADTLALVVLYSLSVDQASGSSKDITLAIYKNGVLSTGSRMLTAAASGDKHIISGTTTVSAATNDYFEVYADVSANATVRVYAYQLSALFAGT